MLGELARDRRVVPLAFHVDYFNEPWKDPFSSPVFSRREAQYSLLYDKAHKVGKPDYLYLTPLVMVDGRTPMVGSNAEARSVARQAIARSLREPAEVAIRVVWEEPESASKADPLKRVARVEVSARSRRSADRKLLIGLTTWEDGLATDVPSGENKGTKYVGRFVARRLEVKPATLRRGQPTKESFPINLEADWKPANCGVAAYVQDETTGFILQAASLKWPAPPAAVPAGGGVVAETGTP